MLYQCALKNESDTTFLVTLICYLASENERLCNENQTLKSDAEGLQEEVKKQTAKFRAEVDEMQRTHQHLQSAIDQTTQQMLKMQSGILQLVQTCDRLNAEKKSLQQQLKITQQ